MGAFSLLVGIGVAAGLAWAVWQAADKQAIVTLELGLLSLLGGLVGARLGYVGANWAYFQGHVREIPQLWLGGLSASGGLVAACLTLLATAWLGKLPLGLMLDGLRPLLATLAVTAWLGCWLAGYAYGPESTAWWAFPARDEWGVVTGRLPVQLMGAGAALALFWLLDGLQKRLPRPGQATNLGLFGLALELLALSYLRADPAPLWRGLRPDAWGALAVTGMAIVLFLLCTFAPKKYLWRQARALVSRSRKEPDL